MVTVAVGKRQLVAPTVEAAAVEGRSTSDVNGALVTASVVKDKARNASFPEVVELSNQTVDLVVDSADVIVVQALMNEDTLVVASMIVNEHFVEVGNLSVSNLQNICFIESVKFFLNKQK